MLCIEVHIRLVCTKKPRRYGLHRRPTVMMDSAQKTDVPGCVGRRQAVN